MNNKKGISAIVATVLIILITVAAVTIIWAAIIPMISSQLEEGTACLDALTAVQINNQGGNTCYSTDVDGNGNPGIKVSVQAGASDVELADLHILAYNGGSSTTLRIVEDTFTTTPEYTVDSLPKANEQKVFNLNISTPVEAVAIAPVLLSGNTANTCDVGTQVVLPDCA